LCILQQKEIIETSVLEQVSNVLKIPVEAIQNFDEEQAVNIIANTFHEGSIANNSGYFNCTFNPLDKMVELYERMLQQQQEMIEKLIEKK